MDHLQENRTGRRVRTYYAQARIREDPDLVVTVRFYRAPPGALPFPGNHAFGSNVWEWGDWEAPRSGLGMLDFNFRRQAADAPPPGVTGRSTPTPLSWFLDGVPAGVVGPYPLGRCTPGGEFFTLCIRLCVRQPMGVAVVPTAGLQVATLALRACMNAWQILLYTNPAVLGPDTTIDQLREAVFPAYQRQSPTWTTTQQEQDACSVTASQPLSWVRGNGAGTLQVYGWALVSPLSGQLIAAAAFGAGPITLALPGDQVFIQGIEVEFCPCVPTAAGQLLGVGAGSGTATTARAVAGSVRGAGAGSGTAATPGHAAGLVVGSGRASGVSSAPAPRAGTASGAGAGSGAVNTSLRRAGLVVGSGTGSGLASTGHNTGLARGSGGASGTSSAPPTRTGLARGSGSGSGATNATLRRAGAVTGSGSDSGTASYRGHGLGKVAGSGGGSGTSNAPAPRAGAARGSGGASATRTLGLVRTGSVLADGAGSGQASYPGRTYGFTLGSGGAGGASNAAATRSGLAEGTGEPSGSSNAPVHRSGTAAAAGKGSATSAQGGPTPGTAEGSGSGSATRNSEVAPGCTNTTHTPYQVKVTLSGITAGACLDCANLNGTWTLTHQSACLWQTANITVCGQAVPLNFSAFGGNQLNLNHSGSGITWAVTLGSPWDGRSAVTLSRTGSGSCSTVPTTVTVSPV